MSTKHCYKATFTSCFAIHIQYLRKAVNSRAEGIIHRVLECVQELWPRTLKTLLSFVKICAGPLHLKAVVFRSFLDHQYANQPALQVRTGEIHLVL